MIWLEEAQYCLRIVDADPETKPPYRAVGSISIHGDVAILSGFLGTMKRSDMREFVDKMRRRGINHLITWRSDDHVMPLFEKIQTDSGPFNGWWHLKIDDEMGEDD